MTLFGLDSAGLSLDEKRQLVYNIDSYLRNLHENGHYVVSFDFNNLSYDHETGAINFASVAAMPSFINEEVFKKRNMINAALLALRIYMGGDYQLDSLLDVNFVAGNLNALKVFYPEDDVEYYENVFASTQDNNIKDVGYINDYMSKKSGGKPVNGISYVKSTPAGRAMSSESGNINNVFIASMVGAIIVLSIGMILTFSNLLH